MHSHSLLHSSQLTTSPLHRVRCGMIVMQTLSLGLQTASCLYFYLSPPLGMSQYLTTLHWLPGLCCQG